MSWDGEDPGVCEVTHNDIGTFSPFIVLLKINTAIAKAGGISCSATASFQYTWRREVIIVM